MRTITDTFKKILSKQWDIKETKWSCIQNNNIDRSNYFDPKRSKTDERKDVPRKLNK